MRARRYLGKTAVVATVVAPGDTVLFSSLLYRVTGLRVAVPGTVVLGGSLQLRSHLVTNGEEGMSDHVVHITLSGPDGREHWPYTRNTRTREDRLATDIRLAENEPVGRWTVVVRDVLTGVSGEAEFQVTPR